MIFLVFLLISIALGCYTLILYFVVEFINSKIRYALTPIMTFILPLSYLSLAGKLDVNSVMFISQITPLAASTLVALPLIERLKKPKLAVFVISIIAICFAMLNGWAEAMSGSAKDYFSNYTSLIVASLISTLLYSLVYFVEKRL
ncbi:MAG: hypothetical protein QXO73_03950 [Archaeoglobaceae archaeon]